MSYQLNDYRVDYRESGLFQRTVYVKGTSESAVRAHLMDSQPYIFPVQITRVLRWDEMGEVV